MVQLCPLQVEDACYAINVRGSEIPKSHFADIFDEVDVGSYSSSAAADPDRDEF